MVSPKLHQAFIRHAGNRDRLTQIVPVGLDTRCQMRDVVGRYAWRRDRVERMELAEENFDDTLSWSTNPPNHCNLAGVVDLIYVSDQRYGYATRLRPDCKSTRPPRQAGFDVRCRTLGLSRAWKPGWVGTRRVAYEYVSSSPPFSTGRAAFTASGSTPLVDLQGVPMKPLCPLRRHPQDCTRV